MVRGQCLLALVCISSLVFAPLCPATKAKAKAESKAQAEAEVQAKAEDESCPAGAPCSGSAVVNAPAPPLPLPDEGPEYPWPSARGRMKPGLYSTSPHKAPKSWEKKLAWTFPGPRGNHSTVFVGGVCIDGEGNIYTAAVDAVYKLDKYGELKWIYPVATSTTPTIHGGALYTTSRAGQFIKLDLQNGTQLWATKVSDFIGPDIPGTGVSEGLFISCSHAKEGGGSSHVTAVNTTDGAVVWAYKTEAQLWNFQPVFTGEGTFIFQDQTGGVYHLRTATGEVLWATGYKVGWEDSWTDGLAMLGPNRLVYVTHSECSISGSPRYPPCGPLTTGTIQAYHLDSGELAWSQVTPYSPNSQPVVAKIGPGGGYSVVLPIGNPAGWPPSSQVWQWSVPLLVRILVYYFSIWLGDWQTYLWHNTPIPSIVQAYDAETGTKQWSWAPPPLVRGYPAGDEELFQARINNGAQMVCMPNLWASPTVDAEGTIFMAHSNGKIYALRDANGDGAIDPATEVTEHATGVAFGHAGPAVAEGTVVVANCDRVLVFKD